MKLQHCFERFQDAGHYLHHERPTELVLRLSDFLDKLQARPAQLSARKPILAPTRSWEGCWAALFGAHSESVLAG